MKSRQDIKRQSKKQGKNADTKNKQLDKKQEQVKDIQVKRERGQKAQGNQIQHQSYQKIQEVREQQQRNIGNDYSRRIGRKLYFACYDKALTTFGPDDVEVNAKIMVDQVLQKLEVKIKSQPLDPKDYGISHEVQMRTLQKRQKCILTYKVPENKAICQSLKRLDSFIQNNNFQRIFCQFQWSLVDRSKQKLPNTVLITVYQDNPHVNPQLNQSTLDLASCLKNISKAYVKLTQAKILNSPQLELEPKHLFTTRAITIGAYNLKINLIQGVLQAQSNQQFGKNQKKGEGQYLSSILIQFIQRQTRYSYQMSQVAIREYTEHFLQRLKVLELSSEAERLIFQDHPLFLTGSQKRTLIHDASDFIEHYNNQEAFLKSNSKVQAIDYKNAMRILRDWINYHAFTQQISNQKSSQRSIYNWLKEPLQEPVIKFCEFNIKNSGKPFVEYNFRDHLRFVRNGISHPEEVKSTFINCCKYKDVYELLAWFQQTYPRFLTFVYDLQRVQHQFIKNFIEEANKPEPKFNIKLSRFTVRGEEKAEKGLFQMMEQVFDFKRNFYWKHLDGQKKANRTNGVGNDQELMRHIQDLENRFNQKLRNYYKYTSLLTMQWNSWVSTSQILYQPSTVNWIQWFNKNYLQIDPQDIKNKYFLFYLKAYYIALTNQKVFKQFNQLGLSLILYSVLASKYFKDSTILSRFQCPHYAKGYCVKGNNCSYKHHRGTCPEFIKGACQQIQCLKGHHPLRLCSKLFTRYCDKNCEGKHWPICPDYYWTKCEVKNCRFKGKFYHPPVGVCITQKKGQVCYEQDRCGYYHPLKQEVPTLCPNIERHGRCRNEKNCTQYYHPLGQIRQQQGQQSQGSLRRSRVQ